MSHVPHDPNMQQPQPQRGWFARNMLWLIPTIVFLPLLMCLGCCGGLFTIGINALRNAEPYTIAMERIRSEPQITAALGEPIDSDIIGFNGQYNQSPGTGGTADYTFTIRGPSGTAQVYFYAQQNGQQWEFDSFDVTLQDGTALSLAD